MRICKDCNVKMREVMSFSKEKRERFSKCPICFDESGHKVIEKNDGINIYEPGQVVKAVLNPRDVMAYAPAPQEVEV